MITYLLAISLHLTQGCFDLGESSDTTSWEEVDSEQACKDRCAENCLGYQFYSVTSDMYCSVLTDLPEGNVVNCRQDENFAFRIEKYPYLKMENTCLLNEIYNSNDGNYEDYRIYDTEEYECLALCEAHPFCRYYLWGTDPLSTTLELRECRLFKAQAKELDDCDCADNANNENYGRHCGLTAYVNGRTFVDQLTWFGEPERTYATLPGLSYQECAAVW